jgi:hypothetical protein
MVLQMLRWMRRSVRPLACVLAAAVVACDEPTGEAAGRKTAADAKLVACPASEPVTATATITPLLGGTVSAAGSSITLPVGAVALPTVIALTVPASPYMEIDVRAGGLEHLVFQLPVQIVIDYSRCARVDIDRAPLSAWHIDSQTKALLEDMNGTDDKVARKITFTTGHLSSYAIAQRSVAE